MDNIDVKKYLIQGGIWALSGKGLTVLMSVALPAQLARMLPPEEMGVYFLAFNLATFFAIFACFGLDTTLLRFVSKSMAVLDYGNARASIQKGLTSALVISLLVSIIFYMGVGKWVALHLFESVTLADVFYLISVWLILLSFQLIFGEIYRGFKDIRSSALFGGLITATLSNVFLFWLRFSGVYVTLQEALFVILLAGVVNICFASLILCRRLTKIKSTAITKVGFSEITAHAWPLFINKLTIFLVAQSGLWVVAAFCSDKEVAIFGSVTRLIMSIGMALTVVNLVIPPLISQLTAQDQKDKLEKVLRLTATIAAIPAFIILVIFILFGDFVLGVIFGEFYSQGAVILIILSVGPVISVLVGSSGYVLLMNGYQKTMMFISIGSVAVLALLGLVLVRLYGVIGVAVASSVALIIQQLLMLYFTRRYCGLWTHVDVFLLFRGRNDK